MYYHILPMKSNQVGCNKRKEINNEKNISIKEYTDRELKQLRQRHIDSFVDKFLEDEKIYDGNQGMFYRMLLSCLADADHTDTAILYNNELESVEKQLATARKEVEKPFDKEQELTEKTERLSVLNGLLNVDKKQNEIVDGEIDEAEPPARKEKELER